MAGAVPVQAVCDTVRDQLDDSPTQAFMFLGYSVSSALPGILPTATT